MAKLSARGRSVVYGVVREYTEAQLQAAQDRYIANQYPDGTWTTLGGEREPLPESVRQSLTVRERVTRRLMSDGKVLEKRDVWFRSNGGERRTYPWKVRATLKAGHTPADWLCTYTKLSTTGQPSPWSPE